MGYLFNLLTIKQMRMNFLETTTTGLRWCKKGIIMGISLMLFAGYGLQAQALEDLDGDGFYDINTIEDLNSIRDNLERNYELLNNLDFADPNSYASGIVNNAWLPSNNADPSMGIPINNPSFGQNPGWDPIGYFNSSSDHSGYTRS